MLQLDQIYVHDSDKYPYRNFGHLGNFAIAEKFCRLLF